MSVRNPADSGNQAGPASTLLELLPHSTSSSSPSAGKASRTSVVNVGVLRGAMTGFRQSSPASASPVPAAVFHARWHPNPFSNARVTPATEVGPRQITKSLLPPLLPIVLKGGSWPRQFSRAGSSSECFCQGPGQIATTAIVRLTWENGPDIHLARALPA